MTDNNNEEEINNSIDFAAQELAEILVAQIDHEAKQRTKQPPPTQ